MVSGLQLGRMGSLLLMLAVLGGTGCMTVSDSRPVVQSNNSSQRFAGKKIAMLPVKTQSSLAPDSVMSIRTDVTRSLAPALRSRLPQAEISDTTAVADELNQKNALPLFEQMVQTYENTGVYDKQKIAMLGQMLNANYLLVSRLKAEKMDLLISQGTGGSLDLSLIEVQTAQVAWAGSGEWKRGGVLGFGGATSQEVASGLVEKALAGLL